MALPSPNLDSGTHFISPIQSLVVEVENLCLGRGHMEEVEVGFYLLQGWGHISEEIEILRFEIHNDYLF